MVTPDTYTRIARHSIDGWTVLLKLYWAITPSPSPQLYFPVINTRGRKQRSAEPEPLSQFASGRFLKQHSVLATLLGTNHKKSLVFGLFHKGNCSYRLSQCGLHGNIVVMKCLSKDINRFHFITIPFKILRHFTI